MVSIIDGVSDDFPSTLDPNTCVRRGLCPVTEIRGQSPVESHSLYYEVHGTGPERIVFIMGMGGDSSAWNISVPFFAESGKYTVLVFDNRGVGNSGVPKGPYTTEGMAEDVRVLLDYMDWKEPRSVHVVGASLGGMIAQELAYKIHERIATLALLVTTPGGWIWENVLTVPTREGLKILVTAPFVRDKIERGKVYIELLFSPGWLDLPAEGDPKGRTNRDVQVEMYFNRPRPAVKPSIVGGLSQFYAGLTHRMSNDRLAHVAQNVPKVLILTGEDDNIVNSKNSLRMKKAMRGAELIVWGNAGHALGVQHVEKFNLLLQGAFEEGRHYSTMMGSAHSKNPSLVDLMDDVKFMNPLKV